MVWSLWSKIDQRFDELEKARKRAENPTGPLIVCNILELFHQVTAFVPTEYQVRFLEDPSQMTPGIASYVTELLFRNGVNILDAFLGYGDIIMVVDDKDGPLAYDVLQREIQGSNQPKK